MSGADWVRNLSSRKTLPSYQVQIGMFNECLFTLSRKAAGS